MFKFTSLSRSCNIYSEMIKNIIFDFGKVLVDYDFSRIIHQMFSDADKERRFTAIATSDEFLDRCDMEEIPFREIIEDMKCRYPEFKDAFQAFYERYPDIVVGEMAGMRELLERLKAKGFRLYGLTNWCDAVHEVMRRYEIFRLLDGRVISSEEKLIKPDTAIYLRVCEKYNLDPAECLFTDDKQKNIDGAISAGMEAVRFTDAEALEDYLRDRLHIVL